MFRRAAAQNNCRRAAAQDNCRREAMRRSGKAKRAHRVFATCRKDGESSVDAAFAV
jgi:hypothetical protein